ncbi:MAG: amidohydrolase family protein, partial [Vicinamibacterales bacterium]
ETLLVSRFEPDPSIEGKTLAALAAAAGRPPEETALDLVTRAETGLVSFNMAEDDIARIMRQSWTMTCTDGDLVPLGEGKPHPRAYGAFPRKIRVYVEERGVVELPFAVRSMTSLPAAVFGLKDRGVLRPGAFADVLVFDPAKLRDTATYQDPHQLAEGIDWAIVNGQVVRDAGRPTAALPGRVVTPARR